MSDTEDRLMAAANNSVNYAFMDACKEIDRLRTELTALTKQLNAWQEIDADAFAAIDFKADNERLTTELAVMTAERDAANRQFESVNLNCANLDDQLAVVYKQLALAEAVCKALDSAWKRSVDDLIYHSVAQTLVDWREASK